MTTSGRRPAAAPLLLPLLAAVLATSGCSFRGDVSRSGATAARSAASTRASTPTSSPPSAPTTAPTSAPGAAPTTTATTAATATRTTSASTAPAAGSGAAPACRTGDLAVGIGDGEGAAGSVHTAVELTNTGAAACVLSGHPGVSFVAGQDGHQVGASAAREGTDLTAVVLAPGAHAHAQLRIANAANFDAASCRPTPVDGFRVYPPDQRASAFVPRPGTACASSSTPQLTVGPVEPGAATR